MNKIIIAILILILAILPGVFAFSMDGGTDVENKTELTLSSEGPIPLSEIIDDIKNEECYEGYDNETVAWMESLGDKQVFVGDGIIVIMDECEASKIPSQYVTDAYIEEYIECDVLENHSIGNVKYPKNVLLIENVDYLGEEIHYLNGA